MSTKRDLVEAHGYNRRRLVTAFVSGAPGGREVEPVRHGRTIIGGVVLAGLVLAGAAVSGFLQKPPPRDWDQSGLVIGADSGSRFLAQDGTLFPVINTTSARLLIPDGVDPVTVSDELIASKRLGSTVGIAGAPEVLPGPDQLVDSGWTACTNSGGGVQVTLPASPDDASTPATDEALLVSEGGDQYLVTGDRRYPVPRGDVGQQVLRALELDGQQVLAVKPLWLDLFRPGAELSPTPQLDGAGSTVQTGVPGLDTVGTPVVLGGGTYLLGPDGNLLRTTEFADAVFTSTVQPVEVSDADGARLSTGSGEPTYLQDWPESAVVPFTEPEAPCVRLDRNPESGQAAEITLATAASDTAESTGTGVGRSVALGGGAVFRATTGGVNNSGSVYLVDGAGTAYAVGGNADGSSLPALGYGDYEPRPVPQPWLALFSPGPQLDPAAAALPPAAPNQAVAASDEAAAEEGSS